MSPLAWNFIAMAFNLLLFVWNMTRYGLAISSPFLRCSCGRFL
jgi:hypothetical protein